MRPDLKNLQNPNNRQGSFNDEVKDIAEVSTDDAYRMGMKTMLRWIKRNMDPKKTRVFFASMSPSHGKYLLLPLLSCARTN